MTFLSSADTYTLSLECSLHSHTFISHFAPLATASVFRLTSTITPSQPFIFVLHFVFQSESHGSLTDVVEFLLGRYCASTDEQEIDEGARWYAGALAVNSCIQAS